MMEKILRDIMEKIDEKYNFDTYAGRKLYSYLYDSGYENIEMNLAPHHLFYGKIDSKDIFNWTKKVEIAIDKLGDLFDDYPGGSEAFIADFRKFIHDPRRFTYTSLILCKGRKPLSGRYE
jgi:hypothetical protein